MDPLDISNELGENEGIPDSPHVEILFEALNDTLDNVGGNEGLPLTQSQHYARGVLSASGVRNVAGNESFFGSIKNGAVAVYDYIVKMFKSVFGFFFNRDAAKAADDAKAEVKEDQKKLADLKNATPDGVAHAKAAVTKLKGSDKDVVDLDNDTVQEIMTKLDGSPSEQKAGVAQLVTALPKANKKAQERYSKSVDAVIGVKTRLIRVIEAAEKSPLGEPVTGVTGYVNDIGVSILAVGVKALPAEKALITLLQRHKTINSMGDSEQVGTAINKNLDDMKSLGERYKGHTSRISSEVKEAEQRLKENTGHGATKDHVNKKRLDGLRNILSFTTNIAQGIKKSISELERLQKSTNQIFGV